MLQQPLSAERESRPQMPSPLKSQAGSMVETAGEIVQNGVSTEGMTDLPVPKVAPGQHATAETNVIQGKAEQEVLTPISPVSQDKETQALSAPEPSAEQAKGNHLREVPEATSISVGAKVSDVLVDQKADDSVNRVEDQANKQPVDVGTAEVQSLDQSKDNADLGPPHVKVKSLSGDDEPAVVADQNGASSQKTLAEPEARPSDDQAAGVTANGSAMDPSTTECQYFLMKSEPDEHLHPRTGQDLAFSLYDLKAMPEQTSMWDGVRNYTARNIIKSMKIGDLAVFYHSNCAHPGAVGIVKIVTAPYPDPTQFDDSNAYYDAKSKEEDPKWFTVDVQFVKELERMISLKEIKFGEYAELKDMALIKQTRLSVQTMTAEEFKFLTGELPLRPEPAIVEKKTPRKASTSNTPRRRTRSTKKREREEEATDDNVQTPSKRADLGQFRNEEEG